MWHLHRSRGAMLPPTPFAPECEQTRRKARPKHPMKKDTNFLDET